MARKHVATNQFGRGAPIPRDQPYQKPRGRHDMTRSKGPKPYVFQEFPKMVYHGETGAPLVVNKESEIPETHVDHISKIGKSEEEIAAEKQAVADEEAAKQKLIDDAAKEAADAQAADDKAAKALFKKLKMDRTEAEKILTEDGVDFNDDDDDLTIAMAVKELLEDDDGE